MEEQDSLPITRASTPDDVCNWAKQFIPEDCANMLLTARINGVGIFQQTMEHLQNIGIPYGPALNLFPHILHLKNASNESKQIFVTYEEQAEKEIIATYNSDLGLQLQKVFNLDPSYFVILYDSQDMRVGINFRSVNHLGHYCLRSPLSIF
eukprot:TRINITY_DN4554_c0_g2_i3.p1 TRINITY_DN4554_c0_g2~~TRINITY_DN4554_c0_g2_i3.p1  ORF type:complete len:151 (-),score=7.63 TRINITY_DN4554_c0_g2_i3:388-840(-)